MSQTEIEDLFDRTNGGDDCEAAETAKALLLDFAEAAEAILEARQRADYDTGIVRLLEALKAAGGAR